MGFNIINATDSLKDSHPKIVENFNELRSNFEGTDFPADPVKGQQAVVNDKVYFYNGTAWVRDKDMHTHDDKYYTETEIDNKLATKSDSVHTHDNRYYTETEIDAKLAAKSDATHAHDGRYYTETEIDAQMAGKADSAHDHDGRYYTETEIDAQMAGKADSAHDHDAAYVKLEQIGTAPDQIPTNADIVIPPYKVVKPQTILEAPDVFLRNIGTTEWAEQGNVITGSGSSIVNWNDTTKTYQFHTTGSRTAYSTDVYSGDFSVEATVGGTAGNTGWNMGIRRASLSQGTSQYYSGYYNVVGAYGFNATAGQYINTVTGTLPNGTVGTFAGKVDGTVLKIERIDGTIKYYRNGVLEYTAPTPDTADMRIFIGQYLLAETFSNWSVQKKTEIPHEIIEDPATFIPAHTSATSDFGTISASGSHGNYPPFWTFRRDGSTSGWLGLGATPWIRYVFTTPQTIIGYKLVCNDNAQLMSYNRWAKAWNFKVGLGAVAVPDTVADTQFNISWSSTSEEKTFMFSSPQTNVKSFEVAITQNGGSTEYAGLGEITPIFGKTVASGAITGEKQVEYMTGATAPEGHAASASSVYSTYQTWKAFQSGNESLALIGWMANAAVPQWLRRDFPSAKKITQYRLGSKYAYPKSWALQGSNDGSAWTDVDTRTDANNSTAITPWFVVQNPAAFSKYRLYITAQGGSDSPNYVSVACFEMKEEVVSSTGVVVERDVHMVLADGEGSVEDFTTTQRIVPLEMSTTADWTRVMGSSMTGTLGGGTLAALTDGSLAEVAYTAINNNITHDAGVAKKLRFKMCVQSNVTTSHTFVVETSANNSTWTPVFSGTIASAITAGWMSTSGEPSSYLDAGTNRYIRWRMTSYAAYQREVWLEAQLTTGDPVLAVGQQFIVAGPDGATATLNPPVYDPASGKWSDGKKQIMLGWVQVASYGVTGIYQCKKGVTVELAASGTTLPSPFINLPIFAVQGTTICPVVNNQITGVTVNTTPVRVWRID